MNQPTQVKRNRHRPNRRGQAILEYGILAAAVLLGTVVSVVVLNKKIADLVGYSIDVTTYDPELDDPMTPAIDEGRLNASVENQTFLPTRTNADGETVLGDPTTLDEATGTGISELFETELP